VGIGTASPDLGNVSGTRVLTIASPTAERWGILELAGNRTYGGNQVGELKFISTDATNNGTLVSLTAVNDTSATGTGGSLKFNTRENGGSLTERMRISSGGSVNVGAPVVGHLGVRGLTNDSTAHSFEAANSSGNSLFIVRNDGLSTFTPSGGSVVIGSSGHITSTQALDSATAGGRFIGSSNRGVLGDIRIEQTTTGADGGYIRFMTSPNGSTSPTEKMRISSGGVATFKGNSGTELRLAGPSGYYSFMMSAQTRTANAMVFSRLGTDGNPADDAVTADLMTILYTGRVGIGTTSPGGSQAGPSLQIGDGVANGNGGIRLKTSSGGWGYIEFYEHGAANVAFITGYRAANNTYNIKAGVDISANTGIQMTTGGNVGIGIPPISKLHLSYSGGSYGTDATSGFINQATTGRATQRIRSIGDSAAELFFDINGGISWDLSARGSSESHVLNFYGRNTSSPGYTSVTGPWQQFYQNGNVTIGGTLTENSDVSLKENIKPLQSQLEIVSKLNPISYNKIGQEESEIGFIAQEVEKLLPELVNENTEGLKSLAYGRINVILVKAIQEQQAQIEELKSEIQLLKNN
tara:strand:- start:1440 stop:3182 length:1743 start_codon:yes stop_codon:yes gene_type:complete